MIRDQCHAYCRCSYCAQQPREKSFNAGASMWATMEALDRPGMPRDELYMKSLHQSLRAKAFLDSSKNAGKFIPDEQLLSSTKRREAKELALAAELVPVRRRDRLQELVLLEHKERLREEAALRAERRALGLPEEEEEPVSAVHSDSAASTRPSSKETLQQRLSSGAATPASRCSAEHDLHTMLKGIRDIVDEDPAASSDPLSREQVYKLRQLMHTQKKKTREMIENCENQPHVCGHCLDVNVQARHLSASPHGSVAFGLTGKVINPEEGVKFGTDEPREPSGLFNASTVDPAMVSGKKSRLTSYNAHPYGTGMVFLPVSSLKGGSQSAVGGQSTRFRASFNNNIGSGESVEEELQFPGSTYNVYDTGFAKEARPQAVAKADKAQHTVKIDTASSNESSQCGANEPKAAATAVPEQPTYNSSAAMWMTTNQDRELDMRRFMEFQQKLKANSKRVYAETASRSAKAPSA
ncbi:conserved hypothetical protein [Leishmania mexicana MHOM/GT/2001/U1103]|uniref:Uncharacterized protein n=1 Tax=Leishmania mexicana (strain MHOM/GT/2001/U1103) TaxID=929439 RepID=E9B2F6_LEIMU|nr:conserved hypothetical protein [Leishmania mexicana MHOM/GT/2001/U1103]CBZ29419.1 conserved hypothetical protein [Leishmania mexicana MHOM/GT/2001/U1103]